MLTRHQWKCAQPLWAWCFVLGQVLWQTREMIYPMTGPTAEFRCSHSLIWDFCLCRLKILHVCEGGKGGMGSKQHAKFYFKSTSVPAQSLAPQTLSVQHPEPSSGQSSASRGGLQGQQTWISSTFMCSREDLKNHFDKPFTALLWHREHMGAEEFGKTRGSPRHFSGCSMSLAPCTSLFLHPSFQPVPPNPGFAVAPALSTSSAPLHPALAVLLLSSRHCCPEELAVPFQLLLCCL